MSNPGRIGLVVTAGLLAATTVAGWAAAPPRAAKKAASGVAAPATPTGVKAHPGYLVLQRACFKCHGEGGKLAHLDLRTRELAVKGGEHGPALGANAAASKLFAMVSGKLKPEMPPTGRLPDADIQALRQWLDAGAPYPQTARAGESAGWWAFRPVAAGMPPAQRDPWIRNPIDAYVLQRQRKAGLQPAPEADRTTLLRRVSFDLTGLPPTPETVDAFLADRDPNAWEKVVDRLLATPQYGERWARHWLDLARYAETEGFKADELRPNVWRYRDYVIQSFNADKPYDRFIREQLAGDELFPQDTDARIATGFNRHWADESNARNIRLRRQEILNDITDTTASVFLGLTVGCARCHDHKYDPITHRDYYRLQAFFAATYHRDDVPLAPDAAVKEARARQLAWETATAGIRHRIAELEAPVRQRLMKDRRMPFGDEILQAVDTDPARRTPLQQQIVLKVAPQLVVDQEAIAKALKGELKTEWESLQKELKRFDALKPAELPRCSAMQDAGTAAPAVHVLNGGVYDSPLEEVKPGFLSAVSQQEPRITPLTHLGSTGRRSALAHWIASPDNPLTARVMVNRVWQYHFGTGIVPTASDFGRAGELPTHPELLDDLAHRFTRPVAAGGMGWSLKRLHRLIVTSATYRQSSAFRPAMAARDPENRLLWRYRRWRLEGEAVRDACLAVSGELNLRAGGPSVYPELPEGLKPYLPWPVTEDAAERNRRSVYVFVRRNMRYPLFEAFDFPDTHEPCSRRSVTNTAPQALMLLNSNLVLQRAQALAGRVLKEAPDPDARVDRAFRLALSRPPDSAEREASQEFLRRQATLLRERLAAGEKLPMPAQEATSCEAGDAAALVDFCHALLNSNAFLYVD